MDWKTASSHYAACLNDALTVYRYAMNLANLPQAQVPAELKQILVQEAEPTRRQLDRLRKGEFRIAVVGLEKAGKSTFINAWLECDLLPAKSARCTFTTTQIYSVVKDSEQRLEVQVRTEQEYQTLLEDLEKAGAKEDLKTIQENQETLEQIKRDGSLVIPFTRLEDIRDPLTKYVADQKYAYAVLEARLYTNKLAQADGIVFYDVPGLDSGLAKHMDEGRAILADCDAVIVIQRFSSLRDAELKIIQFTDSGDKNVKIADKLFVFLSHIDAQGSAEALKTHIEAAAQDWLKRAELPQKRIVAGSAGAYLILNHLASEQTKSEIGTDQQIRAKLKSLTNISDDRLLNTDGTGLPEIKQRIENYINDERVSVLQKRCKTSIDKILENSEKIYRLVSQRYPENPEEAKQRAEEKREILFAEWWGQKWEQTKADLKNFYQSSMIGGESRSTFNSSPSIQQFRQRYLELVKTEMQELRQKTLIKKNTIFDANSTPTFDRAKANFYWRDDLYDDVTKTLYSIANKLAVELQEEALRLISYMSELLWDSREVEARLIKNSQEYLEKLENSLGVLFLRFARPVAEALVRGPLNSDTRKEIIQKLGADIELVDIYYRGEEPAFRVMKRYANYGAELLVNPELRHKILGIKEITTNISRLDDQALPEDEVVFEVENDIAAFEEYLRCAIFEAASFESYFTQELRGLLDSFREKKDTWTGVVRNEWKRANPTLVSQLPEELRPQEFDMEVSDNLRQLGVALKRDRPFDD